MKKFTSLKKVLALTAFVVLLGDYAFAQFSLSGEVRPRMEYLHGYSTLTDKDSKFANAKFVLNGASYNLGDSFNLGGRNAKIVMGASPQGRDSSTANDILLIVSK